MSPLTSPKTYAGLAAFHAVDAVLCALQVPPIKKALDTVECPENIRPVFPVVKVAAAVGLASVTRFPGLARLTTAMLTLYFILAVGAHVRVRDKVANTIPAATFLAVFAAMTVKGPDTDA
ncbi:DoxX family protein [Mycobacterium vicinigordonae]|uniref:DoxX family protein n=1 Tax=Mycobacterium vicinigordonae TaxID=1719132 RepID=A0A7D6IVA1_9MYCO|nr:DoxX family protein [Mycobacterium vicinigordonae]QLL09599.1 DoxX family protein [Mycobacterium vicinigordonae]